MNSAEQLIQYIKEGKNGLIEPVYSFTALHRETDDIGNTYVEISLEDQMVWLYVDGEMIVETPCVTGNISRGWTTSPGIYPITYKQRNIVLRGSGYASPVKYWMPFNKGIGLHDASWRNKFGGNIYKTDGSHGCIKLPEEAAATIYKHVFAGMPVVVY